MPCGVWDLQGGLRGRTQSFCGRCRPGDGSPGRTLQGTSSASKYLCVGNRPEPLVIIHIYRYLLILLLLFSFLLAFFFFNSQFSMWSVYVVISKARNLVWPSKKRKLELYFTWCTFIRGSVSGWLMLLKIEVSFLDLYCLSLIDKSREKKTAEEW